MIYAFNAVEAGWVNRVRESLSAGVGRFGWSYNSAQNLLSNEDFDGKNKNRFLLELKPDDYVIYINMPTYGCCTLAKVTGKYYFTEPSADSEDFNHRFNVDPNSVREFNRNSSIVPPVLSSRLKLQNRYWRIYFPEEFEQLLQALEYLSDEEVGKLPPRSVYDGIETFKKFIENDLDAISQKLHHTNPNFDLEKLMCEVFKRTDKYSNVESKHGRGDQGADIILTYESEDFPELSQQKICLVQVKSYRDKMDACKGDAVDGLKKAFEAYNNTELNAEFGLIVSTVTEITEAFREKLRKYMEESGKTIGLLCGADLARFVLKNL